MEAPVHLPPVDREAVPLTELLQDAGISLTELCRLVQGRAISLLKRSRECSSADPSRLPPHGTMVHCLVVLRGLLGKLSDEEFYDIASRTVQEVCIPYLAVLSSEMLSSQHNVGAAMMAIGSFFGVVLLHGRAGKATLLRDEVIGKVFVSVVESLLSQKSDGVGNSKFHGGTRDQASAMADVEYNAQLIITLLHNVFNQAKIEDLEENASCCAALFILFEKLLALLQQRDSSVCFLMVSSLLPLFITGAHVERAERLWQFVEMVVSGKLAVECNESDLVLAVLCCFSDVFIYHDGSAPFLSPFSSQLLEKCPIMDLKVKETFWAIVQNGLTSSDPLSRKRCLYLLHRVLVSVKQLASNDKKGAMASGGWVFWWSDSHGRELQASWDDLVLLLETLEEKQVHIIKPVKSRLKNIVSAMNTYIDGHSLLHVSWLSVVVARAFAHEARSTVRWGVHECLDMPLQGSPLLSQENWEFVLSPLLGVLHETLLYAREPGVSHDACPPVADSLNRFLQRFLTELSPELKGVFLTQFVTRCAALKFPEIPFLFITHAISILSPASLLGSEGLAAIRSCLHSGIMTHKPTLRAASQCFLLSAACRLTDLARVDYRDVILTLGSFKTNECLVFGSHAWNQACRWVTELCLRQGTHTEEADGPAAKSLFDYLQEAVGGCIRGNPGRVGVVSVSHLAVVILLATDADCKSGIHVLSSDVRTLEDSLALLLAPVVDTITTARNRLYLACNLVRDAVDLLVSILGLFLGGKELTSAGLWEGNKSATGALLYRCLLLWLPGVMVYIQEELFRGSQDDLTPCLEHVLFYRDALDRLYHFMKVFEFSFDSAREIGPVFIVQKTTEKLSQSCCGTHAVLSPSFLGSLTALTWVCSLVDPPGSSRHSGDELPDPFVIACIGRLPANLKFLKPEDRQSVTGVDEETKGSSAHSGNGSAPNRQEAAIDWGPMISHCFASYWECIRYALQHQGSFGPEAATTATADSTSNVVAAASQADRRDVSVGCSDVVALAQVCLESLDLAGLNLATVIECLSLLVPRLLAADSLFLVAAVDTVWPLVLELKDKQRELGRALKAFLRVAFHPLLLHSSDISVIEMLQKYASAFCTLGESRTGLYNLLVSRACSVWSESFKAKPEAVVSSLKSQKELLLQACMFGPVYKKNLRNIEDGDRFVESLGDGCSSNDLSFGYLQNDNSVRICVLNFLLESSCISEGRTDNPSTCLFLDDFLTEFMEILLDKVAQLSTEKPKYYINTHTHRTKLRLLQAVLVMLKWVNKPAAVSVLERLLQALQCDNQLSVRYMLEWAVALLLSRHLDLLEPVFYRYLQYDTEKRLSRMMSIFTVALHVGNSMSGAEATKAAYYQRVFPLIHQWCTSHHFVVRLYAQQVVLQMWDDGASELFPVLKGSVDFMRQNGDAVKFCQKLEDNFFFCKFNTEADVCLETVFHLLPCLSHVIPEEWILPKEFSASSPMWRGACPPLRLYSDSQELLKAAEGMNHVEESGLETRSVAHKLKPAMTAQDTANDSATTPATAEATTGDVQKKITPWSDAAQVLSELFLKQPPPLQQRNEATEPGGLVLVASLLHKAPNLGGLCRTCEIFGVSEIVLQNARLVEETQFRSLSVSAEKWIRVTEVKLSALRDYLLFMRREGYALVGIEQTAHSQCITEYRFHRKTILVLGNEREGIPIEVLHLLDVCVEIPQFGTIRSLNVHDVDSNALVVAQKDFLCVGTGSTIHLIAKTGGVSPKLLAVIEFDSIVEVIAWSEDKDGTLLVAGDRSGVLHFVSPSLEKVLFSQNLVEKESTTDKATFKEIQFTNICTEAGLSELLVLGSEGTVYIFQHIHLDQLRTALLQDNLEAMKQVQDGITLSKLDLTAVHSVMASSILHTGSLDTSLFISAGCGKAAICLWEKCTNGTYNTVDSTSCILQGTGVTRCAVTTDGSFLITLTDSHTVAVWILSSLIMVNIWTADRVMDLTLLQSAAGSPTPASPTPGSSCRDRLCLITEAASGQRSLSIVSLPGLNVVYSMSVSTAVTLCHGHVTEESLYFIEPDDTVETTCVHLKHLVQALPEDRLSTLLAQGKFEEAEVFAQKFNLDPQLVYKSKARVLSELLCRATSEESPALKDSLIECLEQVKAHVHVLFSYYALEPDNDSFVADIALDSHYPTLETTLAVLMFAKNGLQSTRSKDVDKAIRVKVFSALNKLTTFQMIHREDSFSPQAWRSFLEGSLLEELRAYLQTGSLQQAGWIWNRHQPSLLHHVDATNLISLLQAIPESVPSHQLASWVTKNAVPFILQHTPQLLADFLSWIEQRIRLLELTEKDQWPGSALNMATEVLEAVQSFRNLAAKMAIQAPVTTTVDSTCDPNSPLAGLRALQERLGDLSYLHSNLKCSVSLSDYEKESREVVVFRLLDAVVAAELVGSAIQSAVLPYMERHDLELDAVLLQYIKLFLAQAPRYSTGLSDTPWEAKTIALLCHIKDKELYLAGCAELLKHVQTPWSDSVEALVQECLKIQHPSVMLLQRQYKLLQLKRLLHGYGVRDFNFSNASKGLLYIRRILTHDGPKILEDALQVAEMYHLSTAQVYVHYILKLGLQDRAEDAMEVLGGLPKEEKIAAAQEAFSCAYAKLQLSFSPEQDEPKEYIRTAKAAIVCLKFLQGYLEGDGNDCVISVDLVSVDDKIDLLKRLLALQMEYSVFLTPQELSDQEQCRLMFETKVEEFVKYQQQGSHALLAVSLDTESEIPKHYHDSMRFCKLLGYSEEQLFTAVALSCAKSNQMDKAREICRTQAGHSPSPALATLLSLVVQEGWRMLGEHSASVESGELQAARELASLAATLCHPDDLLMCVEQYQLCSLLCAMHSQCEGGSSSGELEEDTGDLLDRGIFSSWQWSPRFKEDGLVLDRCSLVSAAAEYIRTRLPVGVMGGREKSIPFEPRLAAFRQGEAQQLLRVASQVNQMLQDNGHSQLALQCSLQTLGAYSLYTSIAGDLSGKDGILQQGQNFVHDLLNSLINKLFSYIVSARKSCGVETRNEAISSFSLSCRRIDHGYALALLLMVPPKQAIEKLHAMRSRSASSYSKVIALCKLAIDYGCLVSQPSVVELSKGILSSAEWGKRLSKYKISFTEAFRGGGQEKAKVLLVLFRHRGIDLNLLFQYCCDFELDIQSMLLSYLKVLLTEWEEGFQERAVVVIKNITNQTALHERLVNLLTVKVMPYDYERITFLLENIIGVEQAVQLRPEQGLLLLDCLKRYCRVAPPTDYEKQWFAEHYCANQEQLSLVEIDLPELSKTRLPFHSLLYGSPMKIIQSELSKTTVGKLMPIAKILKLPPNDFFFSAITSVVNQSQGSFPSTQPPTPSPTFADVAPLLDKIQDCSFALTVAKWLAKELHSDADRLEALRAALMIARQWKEQAQAAKAEDQSRAASERVEMLQQLLKLSQTERLLRQHKLDQKEYLQLSNQGATLIITLFSDIPVSKKPAPPVHDIAAQIAHLYNLNLDKIKRNLLEQWLPATGSSKRDMDITQVSMLEDPTDLGEEEEESEDQLNMKRLIYLMNVPDNLEAHTLLLLNWAKRTSSSASPLSRVRALQILFAIAPPDLIERTSGTPIKEVRDYMQRALFVSELEALHMSTSLSAFQSCKKEGLVKSLWRNHAQEPRAMRLICELCLFYEIFDASLWARLLEQLLAMNMLPYLRHVLTTLASHSGHWSISSMPAVWQKMLLAPFQEVISPLMDIQKRECEESLKMLYLCPFPFELNLNAVVTAYCSVEMRVHALAVVLMIPTTAERERAVKGILCGLKRDQLISLLQELRQDEDQSTYFSGVPELVYMHLNSMEQHETLLGSSHFTNYVHFLISKKLLDSLLIKTLQVNRMKEAIQLVELYNDCHQASQAKGIEALKEYVSVRELKGLKLEYLSEQ